MFKVFTKDGSRGEHSITKRVKCPQTFCLLRIKFIGVEPLFPVDDIVDVSPRKVLVEARACKTVETMS